MALLVAGIIITLPVHSAEALSLTLTYLLSGPFSSFQNVSLFPYKLSGFVDEYQCPMFPPLAFCSGYQAQLGILHLEHHISTPKSMHSACLVSNPAIRVGCLALSPVDLIW